MENITTAVFLSGAAPAIAEAVWQYDYKRKLRILPHSVTPVLWKAISWKPSLLQR